MPRPKTFAVDTALDKAMELFRERGYAAITMQDVAESLSLSRATIYTNFGDKYALFVQALRHYGPARAPGLSELRDAPSPRAALLRVFEVAIAGGAGKQRRPCLLINTAMELKPGSDPELGRLVEGAVLDLEERFRDAIERGQSAGEIAASVDPVQMARVLLSQYLGLYVLIRSRCCRRSGTACRDAAGSGAVAGVIGRGRGGIRRARLGRRFRIGYSFGHPLFEISYLPAQRLYLGSIHLGVGEGNDRLLHFPSPSSAPWPQRPQDRRFFDKRRPASSIAIPPNTKKCHGLSRYPWEHLSYSTLVAGDHLRDSHASSRQSRCRGTARENLPCRRNHRSMASLWPARNFMVYSLRVNE